MDEKEIKYVYFKVCVDEDLYNVFKKIIKINKDNKQDIINDYIKNYICKNFDKLIKEKIV